VRRIAFAVLIAAAAFGVWRYYSDKHLPAKVYETFAEEILHQRYDDAAKMCDGLTAADLGQLGSQERIGAGPQMFQTLFPSRFEIESRETTSDGDIAIHAVQTVLFNPVGVESAIRPAMYATLKQVVTLRKEDAGWRVVAFENTFVSMDQYGKPR
jgi:hypothetical protein